MSANCNSTTSLLSTQPTNSEQPHLRPWRAIYFDDGEVGFNWRDTNTFRMGYRWRNVTPSSKARVRRMMAVMAKITDVPMWEHVPRFMYGERVLVAETPEEEATRHFTLEGVVFDYNAHHRGTWYEYIIQHEDGRSLRQEKDIVSGDWPEGGDA